MSWILWGAFAGVAVALAAVWYDQHRPRENRHAHQKGGCKNVAPQTPAQPIQAEEVDAILRIPPTRNPAEDTAKRLQALDQADKIAARSKDDYLAVSLGILRALRHLAHGHFAPLFDGPPQDAARWAAAFEPDAVVQRALQILSWPDEEIRRWVVYDKRYSAKQTGHDFKGIALQGADLSGLDLQMCHFQGVCLDGANLRGATLSMAEFHGASMIGADLRDVTGETASFRRARLTGARLAGAHLRGASFDSAAARMTDFSGANLSWAGLQNAGLEEAVFVGATLRAADMHGASCIGTDFSAADLSETDIIGATFQAVRFKGAMLRNAQILLSEFRDTRLDQADLDGIGFAHMDLRGTGITPEQAKRMFIERSTVELDPGLVPHPESPEAVSPHFGQAHQAWRSADKAADGSQNA